MAIWPSCASLSVGVDEADAEAGQRAAHRAGLDLLARRVADLGRGLGLAVEVADGQAPGVADLVDDLGVERLARGDDLAQAVAAPAPRSSWISMRHTVGGAHSEVTLFDAMIVEQRLGVEARLVEGAHRRAGIPRREERAPGVLRPSRRGDVEMDVAGHQAEHEHGREMADRIGPVRMQHELGLRRGSGGEVEQHRIVGVGLRVRRERGGRLQEIVVAIPARRRVADRDPGELLLEALELGGIAGGGHDMLRPPAREPVGEIGGREQCRRRDHHGAELHRREHRLPQRRDVAEHHQHAVAALHAERAQRIGEAARAFGKLGET